MNVNEDSSPGVDLFMGFKCEAVEDWKKWVPAPTPPRNYTKPETIADWVDRAWVELQSRAPTLPLTGRVIDASVVDHHGIEVVRGIGWEVYNWLSTHIAKLPAESLPLRIWALDGRKLLHLCALNAAKQCQLTASWGLYLNTFVSTPQAIRDVVEVWDPVRLALGAEGETSAKADVLMEYLPTLKARYNLGNPTHQAKFTRYVWTGFGLSQMVLLPKAP